MTEATSYPPIASPRQQNGTDTSGLILLAVAGPTAQRRATVATRLILMIPHFLALYLLGVAAGIVVVIGWLGALVTGRLPRFAAIYLHRVCRCPQIRGHHAISRTGISAQFPPS